MSFKTHQDKAPTHSYKISIKSGNGNTVGFINLSKAFLRATCATEHPTFDQVQAINKGRLLEYLVAQTITLEATEDLIATDISDF